MSNNHFGVHQNSSKSFHSITKKITKKITNRTVTYYFLSLLGEGEVHTSTK